jgi:hypothetical protein
MKQNKSGKVRSGDVSRATNGFHVATSRRLREGKDRDGTSVSYANVFCNESIGCLPKDMNDTGTVRKRHVWNTNQGGDPERDNVVALKIRDTHTHTNCRHTNKLIKYKREGRHATWRPRERKTTRVDGTEQNTMYADLVSLPLVYRPAQAWLSVKVDTCCSCLFVSGVSCGECWIPLQIPVESAFVLVCRAGVFVCW